jgi:hypothetical protein
MTPNEARKPENHFTVKLNLLLNKKPNRIYPELHIGDTVKYYRKDLKHKKERYSVWVNTNHTIEQITTSMGQFFFMKYLECLNCI